MRRFRSYFSKNNTIVKDNQLNSARNPVTEIVYGGKNNVISRFIFDINLNPLIERIKKGYISIENIESHTLNLINSIKYVPKYVGGPSYSSEIKRANSFLLDVFNITEEWDGGSGYDLNILGEFIKNQNTGASNWFERKTGVEWAYPGVYSGEEIDIIGSQYFDMGNENLVIDVTDYINERINNSLDLEITGTTVNGLGIKYSDDYELKKTDKINSVGFHAKNTNTFFEPYLETIINDKICDDRNYFYLNKTNTICLFLSNITDDVEVEVDEVKIFDYLGGEYTVITENIKQHGKGVFCVDLTVSSEDYPDSVIFRDEWKLKINGKVVKFTDKFYIMPSDNFYSISPTSMHIGAGTLNNELNYHFYFSGIIEKEKMKRGEMRKIFITIKELYATTKKPSFINLEYRIYTLIDSKNEIDIIPFTSVNRIKSSYEIFLDTSWLIPNDYFLQIRLADNYLNKTKEVLQFSVI